MDLHMPYSRESFRMTLSDLERLSEIFSDTKLSAVGYCSQYSFIARQHVTRDVDI